MLAATFLISVIFLVGAQNVPNYQERYIYLSEDDNVCLYRPVGDYIKLAVNVEGGVGRTLDAWVSTGCSNYYITYARQIIPMKTWSYITHIGTTYFTNIFRFNEESRKEYREGILIGII